MSYTNTINATRTPEHHIANNGKATNAQGTITAQTLKKVANFIGMDDGHEVRPSNAGYLSTDLELELLARKSAFADTAALEAEELRLRMDDTGASVASKTTARKVADAIESWFSEGNALESCDRIETRAFYKHLHEETNEMQRAERDSRLADNLGETLRKSLAEEQTSLIRTAIASPRLNHVSISKFEPIKKTLTRASEIATGSVWGAAGSVWGSVFQIGQFAARAAQFLGGKAVVRAQDLEREVAAKAPEILDEAAKTAAQIGEQASRLAQNTQEMIEGFLAPATLNWAQLDDLENNERGYRTNGDEVGQLHRFTLAAATSSLIRARRENKPVSGTKFHVTGLLEEMERERRIAQDKSNSTARLNAKRAAGVIMSHRRQVLCKQNALSKAQEVKAASPVPTRQIQFALPSVPHVKRVVPQVASKRYDYARESSSENMITAPKAAM